MKTLITILLIIAALVLIANWLARNCFDDDDEDMDWPNSYT